MHALKWPLNGRVIGKRQNGSTHQSCWFDKCHSCRQIPAAVIPGERNLTLCNAFAQTTYTKMYSYTPTHILPPWPFPVHIVICHMYLLSSVEVRACIHCHSRILVATPLLGWLHTIGSGVPSPQSQEKADSGVMGGKGIVHLCKIPIQKMLLSVCKPPFRVLISWEGSE